MLFSCLVMSDSFATPRTVVCQAPLSMGYLRQEYWSGLPFPSPRNLPHPAIKPGSPALQADSSPLSYQGSSGEGPRHPLILRDIHSPLTAPPPSRQIGKDPDAGKDWRQEKGTTEDEMVEWHHWLDGHEFEQAPGVGDGKGGLVCCSPGGCKESDMTELLN